MATRLTEKLTEVPPVPRKFGEDGGKFYQHYDELADELDEDMVASLKSQLDGILIFAGLFAGVNSAFLAFTLPQMSADPADDTNALLFQIMLGTNRTITSTSDLPSASFSPPAGALPINILFSLSLTLALVASFLAVLGQQWLVYYRKRSGGGAEFQRWEQLRRYLGAKRWRLELVLDDVLPSLLQIGLVIFCVAFILYLRTLSPSLCYAIAAPLCAGGATIVAMAILAAWDRWCPFKTPLSHLVQLILQHTAGLLGRIVAPPASFAAMGLRWLASVYRSGSIHFEVKTEADAFGRTKTMGFSEAAWHGARGITTWFDRHFQRSAEAVDELELVALKRVFCTSEDSTALVHAAVNGQAIFDKTRLRQIFDDDEFKARLHNLYRSSEFAGNLQKIQQGAIVSLFGHIIFCCGSVEEILPPDPTAFGYSVNDDVSETAAIQTEVMIFINNVTTVTNLNPGIFAECPYRTALKNYVPLLVISLRFHDKSVQWHEDFERSIDAFEPASDATRGSQVRPVEHFWFIAQGIKQAKVWDNFHGPEGWDPVAQGIWKVEGVRRVREVLAAYQTHHSNNQEDIVQVIGEAIATLSSPWKNLQPDLDVYVELFERAVRGYRGHITDDLVMILKSLVTLLQSAETRLRDRAAPAQERKSAEECRIRCSKKLAAAINDDTYSQFYPYIFAYAVGQAPDPIRTHVEWMKDIMDKDPMNPENPSMVESFKIVFATFPDPDESVRQARGLDLPEEYVIAMAAYCQLHPVLVATMSKIEATLSSARSISEEQPTVPQPEHRIGWNSQPSDPQFGCWGN